MHEPEQSKDIYPLRRKSDLILDLEPANTSEEPLPTYQEYYGAESAPEGIEKQQIFKFIAGIRKHWLLILTINLLITSLVIVYEAQKPEYYQAEARIQVNNETNPAAGAGGSQIIYSNPGNDPTYFSTQLQILEGAGLLRRVAKTLDLEHNKSFFSRGKSSELTVWQNVERMFGMYTPPVEPISKSNVLTVKNNDLKVSDSTVDSEQEIEQLAPYVAYLKNNLKISPVKDSRTANKETRLIEIEFIHNDPEIAAKMVNTIAETYVLQNLEQKVQNNAAAGDFLQKRVAELQAQIRSGEERLINYGKTNQILSLDAAQNTVVQRLSALNGNLAGAENERIAAEAAYRAALQNPVADLTSESKDARTSTLETQLSELKQQLAQLKLEYTDDWPEVIQTKTKIANLEKEFSTSRKRASTTQTASLEQNYREALAKENELRNNFQKQRAEVLAQNEAAINYRIIQQEIDTNKSLYDGILQRSKETDIILTNTPNNVRIADRALVPRGPAGPQRTRNILAAFLVSLMLGIGLSIALNWLNDNITEADDIEQDMGLPVLGMIPATKGTMIEKWIPKRLNLLSGKRRSAVSTYHMERFEDPVIVEAYNHLRTYLLLSTAGGPPQTILVTSAQPGEGKTVTALNLAKSLAQSGAKVLLIDADLRYPRLHSIKEKSNDKGLSTLLTINNLSLECVKESVKPDTESTVDLLLAGPNTPNPANILGSKEMKKLLKILKNQYDHIIIDSPPVLYFADGIILSTMADASILVVRCNTSTKQSMKLAKKKLLDASARVIGVIFNGIPQSSSKYYNYGYYKQIDGESEKNNLLSLN